MAEELVLDVDWNITKAEAKARKLNREFEQSKQKASEIKKNIDELNDSLDKEKAKQKELREIIKEQVKEAAELDRMIEKVESGNATIEEVIDLGSLDAAKAKLAEMEKEIQKNEQEFKKSNSAEKKITSEIYKQNNALATQNGKTATIGENIALNSKKQNKFSQALKKSEKSAARFGKRIKSLIASALLFSLVTKAFTALREQFGKMITEQGTKTAELAAKLKGGLSVIGTTLYESVRPAIEWILSALVKIVNILANGLAKILGKDINKMKKLASATKKTGEEAKKATAGFDTLQTIDTSSNSSSSSGGGVGTDFSALNDGIDGEIALLMTILSGAALILGVILAFTGANIPLGIGLIAIGALGIAAAITANWDSLSEPIQNTILAITAIVSSALLVLGAIFAFTSVNIPLGIAFMVLGAAGLVTAATLSWNSLSDKTKEIIGIITLAVSSALLVLGVIFAFTGVNIGLGIAFMVLGAAGLVAAKTLSWNSMSDKSKGVISSIMAIGGLLMLIIGILLCITGVGIPLGIALIAIGAAALVGSVALNWNAITDKVKKIASSIGDIFKKCWDGIKKGFKAMVNGIIDLANLWIKGLNLLLIPIRGIIYGVAKAFGSDIKFSDIAIPTIPKLATGAVLPGGSPMLAWVNDQPKGQPYVEGSIENIAAAFEKYLGGKELGPQNIIIKFTGSLSQLARILSPEITTENNRASIFAKG